jgi:hypothetical protein
MSAVKTNYQAVQILSKNKLQRQQTFWMFAAVGGAVGCGDATLV